MVEICEMSVVEPATALSEESAFFFVSFHLFGLRIELGTKNTKHNGKHGNNANDYANDFGPYGMLFGCEVRVATAVLWHEQVLRVLRMRG